MVTLYNCITKMNQAKEEIYASARRKTISKFVPNVVTRKALTSTGRETGSSSTRVEFVLIMFMSLQYSVVVYTYTARL